MADISKINLGGVEYDIRDQKLKEDVEKKADKTYVDEEAERVVGYAEEVADNAEKAAKKYADENKVAKVDGKQLSTEDFTTALKQKLEGLTNYDDADVRSAIAELQNNLDAIVNGDATSAIDSIQEILAFLSTITDTQTLAGIVADLKQYVDDKVASGGGESVEVVNNLESDSTTAALSANQGRVLKEMIEELPSGGGGLELRELKMSGSADDNAYNLETLELMRENKVLPAMNAGDGTLVPLTYGGNGQFILQVVQMGIEMQMSLTMAGDGSITMSQDILAPYVLLTSSRVLEWLTKNKMLAQMGSFEPAFAYYQAQFCLIDYYKATTGDNTKAVVQFNYGSQRFERVYNATTGEEISTTEIPLGVGGGTGVKIYKVYQRPQNADELAANKAAYDAIAASEDAIYQMNWVIGWITASYALALMGICGLAFTQTAPGEDGSLVQSSIINLLINSDGSILNFTEQQAYVPTTEKVEEMIAQAGGGGSITLDTEMSDTSTNAVSNKVIKEYVDGKSYPKYVTSAESLEMIPNAYYVFEGNTISLSLADGQPDKVCEYVIKIVCVGSPNITLPSNIVWANDVVPQFVDGKTYVISIIDNLAVFAEFTTI